MKIIGIPVGTPLSIAAITNGDGVSSRPWSSKNTVDKLCPSFTESGAIVTCEPVEGYPMTVTAEEGATTITRCGKNLFDCFSKGATKIGYYTETGSTLQERYGWELLLPPGTYTFKPHKLISDPGDRYLYGYVMDANNRCVSGKTVHLHTVSVRLYR